ncbi:MAG: GMC family oxidoreductase [Myxococcales bacterium]|nr:GMC family oxidoreductase [Myxococcales bacterium]
MSRRGADLGAGEPVVHGRGLRRGFDVACDVVVVGSGAGGATAALHLAQAGKRVIVLEEGPYIRREDYQRFQPTESVRRMLREAGMLTALGLGQTPLIALTVGRVVGGSSVLTGGVCFRVPSEVHAHWEQELGLPGLGERALERAYEDVERRIDVRPVPVEMRSASTNAFVRGAERLDIPIHPTRRNTGDDCEGNGRCNFGCPAGAKRGVDVAYLPDALAAGARLVSDALVEGLIVRDGRAVGVEGRLLGGRFGDPSHRFRVHARVVVLACGTIHTPGLLARAGVRSPHLGRGITLHPSVRVVARFPEVLNGWDGALQAVYADRFDADGIKLVGVYTAVNILAAGLPGVGPELARRVRELPRTGVFGGMVHDEGGGTVHNTPGREPALTYRMAPGDLVRLRRTMRILCEMALEGGAEEVYPPIFGLAPVRTRADARALETDPIDARRIECLAFHPLGSARMANDARRGVVDENAEVFELPGAFVLDGSVLPTSIGVNSQVPIMSVATQSAWRLRERLATVARA